MSWVWIISRQRLIKPEEPGNTFPPSHLSYNTPSLSTSSLSFNPPPFLSHYIAVAPSPTSYSLLPKPIPLPPPLLPIAIPLPPPFYSFTTPNISTLQPFPLANILGFTIITGFPWFLNLIKHILIFCKQNFAVLNICTIFNVYISANFDVRFFL